MLSDNLKLDFELRGNVQAGRQTRPSMGARSGAEGVGRARLSKRLETDKRESVGDVVGPLGALDGTGPEGAGQAPSSLELGEAYSTKTLENKELQRQIAALKLELQERDQQRQDLHVKSLELSQPGSATTPGQEAKLRHLIKTLDLNQSI